MLTLFLLLQKNVVGYDELWIVGDNFVSKTYRQHVKRNQKDFLIKENFEVYPFCNSKNNCANRNLIARMQGTFIDAVNEKDKLPRYIVIVLDSDLIEFFDYESYGVASAYGELLQYLVNAISLACDDIKKLLPKKATREDYPCIYWAAAPHHKYFDDNSMHTKFNNCLESIVKLYPKMRVIKMKEVWDFENPDLVCNGRFTSLGFEIYWQSIDFAIRFNIMKHEQFLRRRGDKKEKMVGTLPQRDKMHDFFKRNQQHDRFHWLSKSNQRIRRLPTPRH